MVEDRFVQNMYVQGRWLNGVRAIACKRNVCVCVIKPCVKVLWVKVRLYVFACVCVCFFFAHTPFLASRSVPAIIENFDGYCELLWPPTTCRC